MDGWFVYGWFVLYDVFVHFLVCFEGLFVDGWFVLVVVCESVGLFGPVIC